MNWWKDHGTKILGVATAVLTVPAVSALIPVVGPWAGVVTGILTVLRGFTNSANLNKQ